MRTRAEWTKQILADVADLWRHMDDSPVAPSSAGHASSMVKAGCREILEKGDQLVLSDALAQAALLLTMVREACIEHYAKGEPEQEAAAEAAS